MAFALCGAPQPRMAAHPAGMPAIQTQLSPPKQQQQQTVVLMLDAGAVPERPCSSNSADSISASEAFSTAALESDTSEGHHEAAGRQPGMHMQVCANAQHGGAFDRVTPQQHGSSVVGAHLSGFHSCRQPCEPFCQAWESTLTGRACVTRRRCAPHVRLSSRYSGCRTAAMRAAVAASGL